MYTVKMFCHYQVCISHSIIIRNTHQPHIRSVTLNYVEHGFLKILNINGLSSYIIT